MNALQLFLSQPLIQTCDVPAGWMDDWDIPPQGQVYACENEQVEWVNDGDTVKFVDGFMWVHLAGGGLTITIQKGFASLDAADNAAKQRALLTGAAYVIYAPSGVGGRQ